MELIKRLAGHTGKREEKFYKATLFQSDTLLLGVNCLEPGQIQKPHDHTDQDKFYYIVEGSGWFWLGKDRQLATEGDVVWAPAGLVHGVENKGNQRLTMLVGIAPAP
jgi:quercetin dioxygenase-like cupin family protein